MGLIMGVFQAIKDRLRDKARDRLCHHLSSIGMDARLLERGRPEERTGEESLGLIEILNSPIRWINVCKHDVNPSGPGATYSNIYLVPDPTVADMGYVEAKSIQVRNRPVFGNAIDLKWKCGWLVAADFISEISEDAALSIDLIKLNEDIKIWNCPWCKCWAISSNWYKEKWPNMW